MMNFTASLEEKVLEDDVVLTCELLTVYDICEVTKDAEEMSETDEKKMWKFLIFRTNERTS